MSPAWHTPEVSIYHGDASTVLASLPAESAQCCVTSPPYWGLRDYGTNGQLGLEPTPEEYVAKLVAVFREVRRVLRNDGTVWLNLGDSYGGSRGNTGSAPDNKHKHDAADTPGFAKGDTLRKQLIGIPWRVAFAMQADGWYLRSDIIWSKPNPMPESVTDRPTKAHEYLFLLAKSERYHYDTEAITEPSQTAGSIKSTRTGPKWVECDRRSIVVAATRNRRSVWTVSTRPYAGAHFATFPPKLIEPCILAGCPEGGTVLDPFNGSGTTGAVAVEHSRKYVGIELNAAYIELAKARIGKAVATNQEQALFAKVFP